MKKILTLCIIHQNNKVLLGMKKRGFGMGNWNGFGGKVEEGESIEYATKRELLEEAGINALDLERLGVLDFSWKNKPEDILEVNVFKCRDFTGTITETEEMKPEWFDVDAIPLEKMWADDKYWIPLFLDNKKFNGTFIFNEDNTVLEHKLYES